MADIKIKTHTTYTYETTDGREFDIAKEAEEWQEHLENIKKVTMLDSNFHNTTEIEEAFYVQIKTNDQLEAFDAVRAYNGGGAYIPYLGYWYYDDCTDSYVDVVKERDRLQSIIETLDLFGK